MHTFTKQQEERQRQTLIFHNNNKMDKTTIQFLGEAYAAGGGCCLAEKCLSEPFQNKQLALNEYRTRKNDDDVLLLTEGFDKLSTEERERALNELHGVADSIEETPEVIAKSLKELDLEVSRIKHRRSAYDKALDASPKRSRSRASCETGRSRCCRRESHR